MSKLSSHEKSETAILNAKQHKFTLLIISAISLWIIAYGFVTIMDFNIMIGDVYSYWEDSNKIGEEIHPFHVPGWPILIAVSHELLPSIDPALLMQILAFLAWLSGIAIVYKVFRRLQLRNSWYGALFFGVYAFAGLSYVVFPIADSLAIFIIVLCILGYLQENRLLLILGLASGLLIHKGLWPVLGILAVLSVRNKRLSITEVVISGIPFMIYWLIGISNFSDYLWIVRSNIEVEVASRSTFPLFDGFISTIQEGGIASILKVIILLTIFLTAVGLSWAHEIRRKQNIFLSLTLPILLMGFILNGHEIWAMVRFGRLLILPLWFVLNEREWKVGTINLNPLLVPIIVLGFGSNLVFLYYMNNVFFR